MAPKESKGGLNLDLVEVSGAKRCGRLYGSIMNSDGIIIVPGNDPYKNISYSPTIGQWLDDSMAIARKIAAENRERAETGYKSKLMS
jgi:hypothetical protein